jgi:hypothetical protein
MKSRVALGALAFASVFPLFGCSKIAGWAIDKAIGDDAGLAEQALSGGMTGTTSTKNVCDLVTDAEVEAASGKKVLSHDNGGVNSCGWVLGVGGQGSGNVTLSVLTETEMKVIPMFGQPVDVPNLGNKAEWVGNMAPNLRIHVKNGQVLNLLLVDPQAMMKNTGIKTTKIDKNDDAVNMEYPELEKEAIAIGKAAVGRF